METQTITIPKGANILIVSDKVFNFFMKTPWADITEPTISEAADYCGCSVRTLKEDFKKANCPLKISTRGKQGRGSQTRYHKYSVEAYKKFKENLS